MLAVACAHLSIKDSQFDLKGNCTLLLLHKEQEPSRAATKQVCDKERRRCAENTFHCANNRVQTAAARWRLGPRARQATWPKTAGARR